MKHNSVRFHDVEAQTAAAMRVAAQKAALAGANGTFTNRESLLFAFRPVHELMASAISDIDFKLQMKASEFATEHNLVNRDAEQKRLEKVRREAQEREVSLAAYAKPRTGRLKRIGMTLLLIFLSVVESVFNQTGLERLFHTTYIGSVLIGLGLAVLFALIAHEGVPRYLEGGNQRRRTMIVVIIAGAVFFILGLLRINGLPGDVPAFIKLLAFCIISTISYVTACLIGQRLWEARKAAPTDDEVRAAEELKMVRKQIADTDTKLEQLKQYSEELEVYNAHLTEYGTGLKQKLLGEARGIFFDFLKTACSNREESTDVAVFNITEYPFALASETPQQKTPGKPGTVAAVLLMVSAGFLFSCNPKPAQGDMAVTVLIDRSVETPQQYPTADDLMRFTGLTENMWRDEIRISLSTISDVDYEPVYTHVLEGAERWSGNVDDRADTVARFKEVVSRSLETVLPHGARELHRSVVYRTVARHATDLRSMPYKKLYLLVWSDCMNHDARTSFYGKSGRKLLKQPDKLEQRLLEQVPLGNLSGVNIIFIHRPDEKGNADFLAASSFLDMLYSKHGASVRVSATLPNP